MHRLIATVAVSLLAATAQASAAEVHALISTAVETAMEKLVPDFEKKTGHKLIISYDPSGGVARRLVNGEFADLIALDSVGLDKLITAGKVAAPRIDFASTGIGIAVKKGAPHPDVSTPAALKQALLKAKTVGHTAPAGGGITALHIQNVFVRLGIADQVTPKVHLAKGGPNGRVSVLVSSGEAEIALQQISELQSNPEIDVLGLLPRELQQITIYSGGVTTQAKQPEAAKAFLQFISSPESKSIYAPLALDIK